MRKRLVSLVLALLLALPLSACGEAPAREAGKLQIVATLFPYYDMARAIAGDRAEVTLLVSAGRESHSYEPTPLDVIRIGEADLFLYNGGTDEIWATELLSSMDHGRAVAMMEQVETREEELAEGMQAGRGHDHEEDHGHGHDHGDDDGHALEIEYDEHIWTSPVNAMAIAAVIAEALTELDGAGADYYAARLEDYLRELRELDEAFRETVAQGSRTLIVLGDRFPLLYFCEEYGLSYRAAFPGCSTETEPSAATMAYLIDRVREEEIPVVYYLENSSGRVAEAIAEATGAESMVFYSCQTVTAGDFLAGETYLSLMRRNAEALRKGLA